MNCDLIVKGKYVLPMDAGLTIIKNGAVAVADDKIIMVGPEAEVIKICQAGKIMDAGNSIVMPGLVNTHTHAAMAYFRGLADDLPLDVWLNKHIWPAEAKYVNAEFVEQAGELACLEMIKAGVTAYNDMYFFGRSMAQPAVKAGLRALIGLTVLDFKNPDEAIDEAVSLSRQFKTGGLVKITLAPHAVYTCSEEKLLKIKEIADRENMRLHIHISETKKEVDDWRAAHGKTPVQYLDDLGLLSAELIAAHSVWLDENDLAIYKKRQVKVAHCPISNMKLASGVAPLKRLLDMGITVGLGTDSAASNNTLDLFSDMRACALLHKVNNFDPAAVTAREIIKMATINGAKVLGLDKEIGSLETGKKADLITINLNKPHLTPLYDPYAHLVFSIDSGDVENVVVDGKIIMVNRQAITLNEAEILARAGNFLLG